jgi:hypothetical protein
MLFEGLKIGRGWNVWRQRQRQKWKGVVTEMWGTRRKSYIERKQSRQSTEGGARARYRSREATRRRCSYPSLIARAVPPPEWRKSGGCQLADALRNWSFSFKGKYRDEFLLLYIQYPIRIAGKGMREVTLDG